MRSSFRTCFWIRAKSWSLILCSELRANCPPVPVLSCSTTRCVSPTLAIGQRQSIHKASFTRRTLYSVHTVEEYFNENVRKGRKSAGSTNIFLAPRQICLLTMEINAQTNLSELLLGVLFYKSIGIK